MGVNARLLTMPVWPRKLWTNSPLRLSQIFTLLHLLGLDDGKLTYFHGGRFKQLSQFGGQVIRELLA